MADVYEAVAPAAERVLSEEHREILEKGSNISPEIIKERGYYTLTREQAHKLIEMEVLSASAKRGTGWLAVPIYRPDLVKHGEIVRVEGVPLKQKYVWPTGLRLAIDVHPDSQVALHDPEAHIWVTEGIKKADALLTAARAAGLHVCVIALNGNYGWRSTVEKRKQISPDWQEFDLTDRKVYVFPDSDYRTNDMVARGWDECANFLAAKTGEAKTYVVVVPPNGPDKQGADDFLANGGTINDLLALAVSPSRSRKERYEDTEPTPLIVKSGWHLIEESKKGIPHLIHPLLPEASIMLVAGHSGSLKTWHLLQLVMDLATGKRWLDHPDLGIASTPVNSIYVNKEMSGTILGHRLGLMSRHPRYADMGEDELRDILSKRVFTVDEAILDLNSELQRDRLEEAIQENNAKVVVLDSFSMCWSGDENSNSEVGGFYAQMRGIIERTGTSFIPAHHLDKPQSGRSKNPIMFSIRGAGQLVQQADAALIFSKIDPATIEPDCKQIAIVHAKARTAVEIPSFVAQFEDHANVSVSMKYLSQYTASVGKSYEESGKDPKYLDAWILEKCRTQPSLKATASGLRTDNLINILSTHWEADNKGKLKGRPSSDTYKARLKALAESGDLVVTDESVTHGDLYRLPDDAPTEEKV